MRLRPIIYTVALLINFGCTNKSLTKIADVPCDKHAVIFNSFEIEFVEIDTDTKMAHLVKKISPNDAVIGQAIYNCMSGILLYSSEPRMTSGINATLHAAGESNENVIKFPQGINSILPMDNQNYLIRGKLIERDSGDPLPNRNPIESRIDDALQSRMYINNIIFDAKNLVTENKVKGTLDPHVLQNGLFVTYTIDGLVLLLNPKTGERTTLVDTRMIGKKNSPKNIGSLTHGRYLYVKDNLFSLGNRETSPKQPNSNQNTEHSIYHFDSKTHEWKTLVNIGGQPRLSIIEDDLIIVIGDNFSLRYNTKTKKTKRTLITLPYTQLSWRSIARIGSSYLIAGVDDSDDARFFIMSRNLENISEVSGLSNNGNIRISTMQTPLSAPVILQ